MPVRLSFGNSTRCSTPADASYDVSANACDTGSAIIAPASKRASNLFCLFFIVIPFPFLPEPPEHCKADIHNPLRYLLMNAVASQPAFKHTLTAALSSVILTDRLLFFWCYYNIASSKILEWFLCAFLKTFLRTICTDAHYYHTHFYNCTGNQKNVYFFLMSSASL